MSAMKFHKDRQRANRFGGATFTTLCGRMNRRSTDGMNIANTDEEVTCKFCLVRMEAALAKAEAQS